MPDQNPDNNAPPSLSDSQKELQSEIGSLVILFGNTELLVTIAVCGLMRLVVRDSEKGDSIGQIIAPFLDLGRRADFFVSMAEKFLENHDQLTPIREWRKTFRSVSERRNKLLHGAWMFDTDGTGATSLRLKRGGIPDTESNLLESIRQLKQDIGAANKLLSDILRALHVMPSGPSESDGWAPMR